MSVILEKSAAPLPLPTYLEKYPSPLHIYHESYLLADAEELERGLKSVLPSAELYYSAKTNPLPPLLQALLRKGWGVEVVGPLDRAAARKAGFSGEHTLMNGSAWDRATLEDALFAQKVRNFTVDSLEMAKLLGAALRMAPASVRVRVALRISDGNSHFGFHPTLENLDCAFRELPSESIDALGFHIHHNPPASITSAADVAKDFRSRSQRVAAALACLEGNAWKTKISFADLGGGFDSPYVFRPHPADLGAFHSPAHSARFREKNLRPRFSLREASRAAAESAIEELGSFWRGKRILFEPGRAVCTRAMSTLVSVKSVKTDFYPDAEVIITDGNTAILGPLHRGVHEISAVRQNSEPTFPTFVYGNLPHSGDWLFQNVELPRQRAGNRLLIAYTGAYFLPLESTFGHPRPIVVRGDRDEEIPLN